MIVAPELGKRFTFNGTTITVEHIAGGAQRDYNTMVPMLWVEGHNNGQRFSGWVRRADAWVDRHAS